ncbi:MAG: hypothetical protein AAGA11_12085 [Pseudomonadota bacterium]
MITFENAVLARCGLTHWQIWCLAYGFAQRISDTLKLKFTDFNQQGFYTGAMRVKIKHKKTGAIVRPLSHKRTADIVK